VRGGGLSAPQIKQVAQIASVHIQAASNAYAAHKCGVRRPVVPQCVLKVFQLEVFSSIAQYASNR
jgi:hypothetical protein